MSQSGGANDAIKPRTRQPKQTGTALVKAVLSGDSVILQGATVNGIAAPEKEVALSGIKAPLFARGKQATDEPFAWHSREFLRNKLIGKKVSFVVLFKPATGGKEFVSLMLGDESIAHTVVAHGWARVPVKEGEKVHEERQELYTLQQQAEAAGLGVHARGVNPLEVIRDIDWYAEPVVLFNKIKGTPLPAVIEKVMDGSTYRVELLGETASDMRHTMINLNLAGVEAPPTPMPPSVLNAQKERKKEEDPTYEAPAPEEAKPFALEAQNFVETRLLHRDVKVVVSGVDKFGNFFGSVIFDRGDIGERLLQLGYAKLVRWSANLVGAYEKYTQAEQVAKTQKAKLWEKYVEKKEESPIASEISGYVTQVISGDRLAIVQEGSKKEIKISLASIRAPRLAARGVPHEPCAFESREFLRTKLLGKKIKAVVEYVRPAEQGDEPVIHASVFYGSNNANEFLIAEGLATVIRHRKNEDRALNYDRLVSVENQATIAKRGLWNPAAPRVPSPQDLSRAPGGVASWAEEKASGNRVNLAKQHFAFLDKKTGVNGLIEHIFSPTRFKVFIPERNLLISFILAGVRLPERDNNKKTNTDLSDLNRRLLQREVALDFLALDKASNFVGNLIFGRENLALTLLAEGEVSVFAPSANENAFKDKLLETEAVAKEAKKGFWKDYVEPVAGEEVDEKKEEAGNSVKETITITEIVNAANFYVRLPEKNAEQIAQVEAAMQAFNGDDAPAVEEFKRGAIFAKSFDDQWCRVRVEGRNAAGVSIIFIDYGNRETVPLADLRVLPADVAAIPALAQFCTLAALKAPSEHSEYHQPAGNACRDLCWEKQGLTIRVDATTHGKLHVTLFTPELADKSVNQALVQFGWCRTVNNPLRSIKRDYVKQLEAWERHAQEIHVGVWENGVISDDEDDSSAGAGNGARENVRSRRGGRDNSERVGQRGQDKPKENKVSAASKPKGKK